MAIIGVGLIVLGALVVIVGQIMFLVAAFRESIVWGLLCLFFPIVNLIFLILFWSQAKRAFFTQLLGFGLAVAGFVLGAAAGQPVNRLSP